VGFLRGRLCGGDVDPHGGGLGARYEDGGAIVIEVRSSRLFVCLGGWVKDESLEYLG
jgi:hypothetical protein